MGYRAFKSCIYGLYLNLIDVQQVFANTNNLMIVYYAPAPVLGILYVFSYLILTMTTWDRGYCKYP